MTLEYLQDKGSQVLSDSVMHQVAQVIYIVNCSGSLAFRLPAFRLEKVNPDPDKVPNPDLGF
jgi:hypothetical protein